MLLFGRIILLGGWAVAFFIWWYESGFLRRGGAWQPLPFHQLLSFMHALPRDLYLWAYCSSLAPEAHSNVEFCSDVSTRWPGLGRTLWLLLRTEAGVVVSGLALVIGGGLLTFGYGERVRRRNATLAVDWPEPPAPPQSESSEE